MEKIKEEEEEITTSDLRLAKKVDFAGKLNVPTLWINLLPDSYGSLSLFPKTRIIIIEWKI